VVHCGADGLVAEVETCAIACVDDGSGGRCGHIVPAWMPTACDAEATTPTVSYPNGVTLDTTLDVNCSEIVAQPSGPELCVVRAREITLDTSVRVVGTRPYVLVADRDVRLTGKIRASADGITSGPGGGLMASGANGGGRSGAGGAGLHSAGGAGGSETTDGQGGAGGAASPRTASSFFAGGPRGGRTGLSGFTGGTAGGGGGGVIIISCRGTVYIDGTISVGGGGGGGGRDTRAVDFEMDLTGGGGGGAGGRVVLQGARVEVTGSLYANGGGGGGGCSGDNCVGMAGTNGRDDLTVAAGGPGTGTGGAGGAGAGASSSSGVGRAGMTAGGGGGGTGYLEVYTPAGVTPLLTPSQISPPFESPLVVETR
jgi:hypothetical protein